MSIFNRIAAIENKIDSLEARLAGGAGASPGAPAAPNAEKSAQFAGIINSLAEKDKFRPGQATGASVGARLDSASVQPYVAEAAAAHNLDPALIEAVIKQESAYNTGAVSSCGAQGLMQLMPETAKELGVSNSLDARQNVMGGAKYLKQLLDRFDGNMTKAIAGYNAGPGAVEKFGGVPPYSETQNYVKKVLDNYSELKS